MIFIIIYILIIYGSILIFAPNLFFPVLIAPPYP